MALTAALGRAPSVRRTMAAREPPDPVWDPARYLKFADHRLRPALDLIARIPLAACDAIWDLGAGTGSVTRLLAERWPGARVTGLESSPEMLAVARGITGVDWVEGDIAGWTAPSP